MKGIFAIGILLFLAGTAALFNMATQTEMATAAGTIEPTPKALATPNSRWEREAENKFNGLLDGLITVVNKVNEHEKRLQALEPKAKGKKNGS